MESKELIHAKRLTEIEQRRAQLKQELESIEQGLEDNIDDIKESLQQKTDPRHWIRKYPMAALGIAVGVGILVGSSGGGKKSGNIAAPQGPSLFGELKRMLLNKGIAFAVSSAEDLLADRFAPSSRRRNSELEENG
jgi:hypothetical protein